MVVFQIESVFQLPQILYNVMLVIKRPQITTSVNGYSQSRSHFFCCQSCSPFLPPSAHICGSGTCAHQNKQRDVWAPPARFVNEIRWPPHWQDAANGVCERSLTTPINGTPSDQWVAGEGFRCCIICTECFTFGSVWRDGETDRGDGEYSHIVDL